MPDSPVLISEIFAQIKKFIKNELKSHENQNIANTAWRELAYEVINYDIPKELSCIFAIRMAYKIAFDNKALISIRILQSFRKELLLLLFQQKCKDFN